MWRTNSLLGVKGLTQLIKEEAPKAVLQRQPDFYRGKTVAVDASLTIFQIVMGQVHYGRGTAAAYGRGGYGGEPPMGSAAFGETPVNTHLSGVLGRVLWLMENGITPIWVFDGKSPALKWDTEALRVERREKASTELEYRRSEKAIEDGAVRDLDRERALEQQAATLPTDCFQDVQTLLHLAGVPTLQAPGEAEAQCAELVKGGVAYGVATEDLDTLAFGAPVLLRNLHSHSSAKDPSPVMELQLAKVLQGLRMKKGCDKKNGSSSSSSIASSGGGLLDNFIDLCVLLGCDYSTTLRGIGKKKAYHLMTKFRSLDHFFGSELFYQMDADHRIKQLTPPSNNYGSAKEKVEFQKKAEAEVQKVLTFYQPKLSVTAHDKQKKRKKQAEAKAGKKKEALVVSNKKLLALGTQEWWKDSPTLKKILGQTESLVPPGFNHKGARDVFLHHTVTPTQDLLLDKRKEKNNSESLAETSGAAKKKIAEAKVSESSTVANDSDRRESFTRGGGTVSARFDSLLPHEPDYLQLRAFLEAKGVDQSLDVDRALRRLAAYHPTLKPHPKVKTPSGKKKKNKEKASVP